MFCCYSSSNQCEIGTTLEGLWVHPDSIASCDIDFPPGIELFTCVAGPNTNPDLVWA